MGVGSAAVRAGQAFVELATKDNMLVRGLANAERRVKAFGAMTAKAGLALTAAGGSLLAPITKVFVESANRASDMKRLSDQFGVSSEKVSAMAYAFERGGADLSEFGGIMQGLQAKMFAAADGSDETFRRLGLNARNMASMPLDKQFNLILSRVNALANPMDRAAVGTEMFGQSWAKLSNTTLKSADALRALEEEAVKVGAVVSSEDAARGQKITLAFTEAWQALKYAILEVGTALLPQADNIGDVAAKIREAATEARNWLKNNRNLVLATVALGAALVAAGAALLAFAPVLTAVGSALGIVALGIKLLAVSFGFLLTPLGLVLGAVVGLTAAWIALTDSGQAFAGSFGALFKGLGDTFAGSWKSIKDAIASGDLEGALKITCATLKVAWSTVISYLTKLWVDFKNLVVDTFHKTSDVIEDSLTGYAGLFIWATEGKEAAEEYVQGVSDVLEADRNHRDATNRKFRQGQIDEAEAELAKAKNDLAIIKRDAEVVASRKRIADAAAAVREKNAAAAAKTTSASEKGAFGKFFDAAAFMKANLPQPAQLYAAAKGTFSSIGGGNIRGSLGYGDNIAQRQLVTQQMIAKNTAATVAALAKFGITWK